MSAAQQNNPDQALASVQQEIRAGKSDPLLYFLLAELLSSRGAQPGTLEYRQALGAASTAVQLKPDFGLARDVLSRLYLDAGDTDGAIEQCRLALRSDPLDTTAIYRLMRALQSKGAGEHTQEIADLLKRFTAARDELREKENRQNRYQLLEAGTPGAAGKQ